mmetsp:Transcript_8085/g.13860  ORF Transcript_8085/g.13860 Transcript_8085/m.13860 type:complete len:208 (-) Transcript_8085:566-1189(-)
MSLDEEPPLDAFWAVRVGLEGVGVEEIGRDGLGCDWVTMSWRCLCASAMVGRLSGFWSQHRLISCTNGSASLVPGGNGGRPPRTTNSPTSICFMPRNGGWPVYSSQHVMPNAYTSAFSLYGFCASSSGDIHWGVPMPVVMATESALIRLRPKSASLALKSLSRSTFMDLRSRWSMWIECRYSMPAATSTAYPSAFSRGGAAPPRLRR